MGSHVLLAQTAITRSTRLETALKFGENHQYSIQLSSGQSAEVLVKQQGIDVIVELRSPAGTLLDSIDSPTGRNGDEVVEIIAGETGAFTITVKPFDSDEPAGKYTLEVKALRTVTETLALLQTRSDIRKAATEWLRPRSVRFSASGVIPADTRIRQLDELARRVQVLGLGEATHGSREFNDMRFSVTRYLIENHGYRIVAIEASAGTLALIERYVNGDVGRTPEIVRLMESEIWIGKRTRGELYEWARNWNQKHPRDRVRVVGVDPQGSGHPREILSGFIGRAYGEAALNRWSIFEKDLAAADEQTFVFGDSGVDTATRQFLFDLLAMLELDEPLLNIKFGKETVESAVRATQMLAEFSDFNSNSGGAIRHSRDWYMASRVLRAMQERRTATKIVYWAHNAHVVHPPGSIRTTGSVLRQTLGCKYAALAVTFGEGAFVAQIPNDAEDRLDTSVLPSAVDESVESVLKNLNTGALLATWLCANDGANLSEPQWLKTPRLMHWVGGLYDAGSPASSAYRSFDLIRDFDGLVYFPRVKAEEVTKNPIIPARKR
ncbi:MAG: erythromycin esterase family protein [Pyrinomonadaceae bacterium]